MEHPLVERDIAVVFNICEIYDYFICWRKSTLSVHHCEQETSTPGVNEYVLINLLVIWRDMIA